MKTARRLKRMIAGNRARPMSGHIVARPRPSARSAPATEGAWGSGERARALLLYRPDNVNVQRFLNAEPPCGNCDRYLAGEGHRAAPEGHDPVGARVVRDAFGEGDVVRYEDRKVVVVFDDVSYQALALDVVEENDPLRVVD